MLQRFFTTADRCSIETSDTWNRAVLRRTLVCLCVVAGIDMSATAALAVSPVPNVEGAPIYTTHCSDGQTGNGPEAVSPLVGCVAGTPVQTDDGDPDTIDTFDEANDEIIHYNTVTGETTRIPVDFSHLFLSGSPFPSDQTTIVDRDFTLDYDFPSLSYVILLDFDYTDQGISDPIGNFTSDIQLEPGSTVVDLATLSAHGLDQLGQHTVHALLVDTSKSRAVSGGDMAYAGEMSTFQLSVAIPEPAAALLLLPAMLLMQRTRRCNRTAGR